MPYRLAKALNTGRFYIPKITVKNYKIMIAVCAPILYFMSVRLTLGPRGV